MERSKKRSSEGFHKEENAERNRGGRFINERKQTLDEPKKKEPRLQSSISVPNSGPLLKLLDSLPDLRILANEREKGNTEDDPITKMRRMKDEYIRKKEPFIISAVLRSKGTCPICKKEFPDIDYDIFKESVSPVVSIDSLKLHQIREHGEFMSSDLRNFLNSLKSETSKVEPPVKVDHSNVCPFLVRVFMKVNETFKEDEFVDLANKPTTPGQEIYLHLWHDKTMKDIIELLKEHDPRIRQWGIRASAFVVYPDTNGRWILRDIGMVYSNRLEDTRTLSQVKFEVGDYLAISVTERMARKTWKAEQEKKMEETQQQQQPPKSSTDLEGVHNDETLSKRSKERRKEDDDSMQEEGTQ
jgi:histone deacetylase complex subunit SAP18